MRATVGTTKQKPELPPLQAIAQRMRAARIQQGLSVGELSERTKISARCIEQIEAGEFDKLPGRSYVIGFTRSLCHALKLDAADVVSTIKSEMYDTQQSIWVIENRDDEKRSVWSRLAEAVRSTF